MPGPQPRFVQAPPWIVFGVPGVALVLLVSVMLGHWNTPVFRWFNGASLHTGSALWAHLTILGDGLVSAALYLPWIRRHPERVWGGVLGAILMVVVVQILKNLLNLPRPPAVLPEGTIHVIGPALRGHAFPSGHTSTFSLYAGIWALTLRRRWLSVLLLIPALGVGASRMAVGVHWPTDVLAGLALGWLSAWVGLRLAERIPWGIRRGPRLILGSAVLASAVVLLVIDHTGYPGVLAFQRAVAGVCILWGVWGLLRTKDASA